MPQRFQGSQLDRRIQLQQPVVTRGDDYGDEAITWQTVATVHAKRIEAAGGTATSAEQRVATRPVQFLIRYRADVQPTWRVLDGSRRFRIDGMPVEQGRRSSLLIPCEETTDA